MFELSMDEQIPTTSGASLKVIGIGGAGGNAVNSMISGSDLASVQFIVANTDSQALNLSLAQHKIQLGKQITKGLGAGANPEVGRQAAEEDLNSILDFLGNTDILFLTAGLGGGTGSGALPVIAQAAKELGILTIAVVTKPFLFEGKRRQKHAEEALSKLNGAVDTLIVVPNQRLIEISDPKISMLNAFALANDILKQAIKGISDIITKAGHINVDMADVKTIMRDTGMAIMGTGRANGTDRARKAAIHAISSPLLENTNIQGAKGVLINITGNEDLELQEINEAASMIYDMVSPEANIILGSVIEKTMGDEISITVIATGIEKIVSKEIPVAISKPARTTDMSMTQEKTITPQAEVRTHEEIVELTPTQATEAIQEPAIASTPAATMSEPSYDLNDLDTPTFLRKKAEAETEAAEMSSSERL